MSLLHRIINNDQTLKTEGCHNDYILPKSNHMASDDYFSVYLLNMQVRVLILIVFKVHMAYILGAYHPFL